MEDLEGKRVLVTGAASGIGRGAAMAFAREGCRLLLVDINTLGLETLETELKAMGVDCSSYEVDVSSLEKVGELAAAVDGEYGGVDVLVNAAGIGIVGDVVDTPMEDWQRIMGINLWGPIYTIRAFVVGMIQRKDGHVVNVSSLGGLISHGMLPAYCTTKFALVGLSEALAQEVRENDVYVTAFCPGLTRTPIIESMRFHRYSYDKFKGKEKWIMSRPVSISTERTGELMVQAVKRRKPLVVTTPFAKFFYLLSRLSPKLMRFLMLRARKVDRRMYGE